MNKNEKVEKELGEAMKKARQDIDNILLQFMKDIVYITCDALIPPDEVKDEKVICFLKRVKQWIIESCG